MAHFTLRASQREPALQAAKTMIAMLAAWVGCQLLFPQQTPIFGAIAALLCVQPNVTQSLAKGVERVIGVVAGVAVAYGAISLFGPASWLFVLAIVVSIGAGWALRLTTTAANQVAITSILVLALGEDTTAYAVERIVETLVGAVIGVAVNALIAAPVTIDPAHVGVRTLGYEASLCLDTLADALSQERDRAWLDSMLTQSRRVLEQREGVRDLVGSARESLALNPRRNKHRQQLAEDTELMRKLGPIITQLAGMIRALHDNYSASLIADPAVHGLAEECRRAAHDLRRISQLKAELQTPEYPATSQLPALTSPFVILRPNPQHWIVIGSLMEDLRRVRQGIMEMGEPSS